ncbi:uncharacterized protein METZ01_LOCUS325373 [marine metagenome]|uniref:Uncharacterized protein n=1 Tax=marine metagenome TaxID=408172 RepID=A0A382PGJ5_9ZZZZ|tara:strand:- start:1569 stop:1679 length:111 start_codon:yes stop_codon:yes gene_type:complete
MEMMLVIIPLVGLMFVVMGLGLVLARSSGTAGKKKK